MRSSSGSKADFKMLLVVGCLRSQSTVCVSLLTVGERLVVMRRLSRPLSRARPSAWRHHRRLCQALLVNLDRYLAGCLDVWRLQLPHSVV